MLAPSSATYCRVSVIGRHIPGSQASRLAGYYDDAGRPGPIAKIKDGFVPPTRKDVAAHFAGLRESAA